MKRLPALLLFVGLFFTQSAHADPVSVTVTPGFQVSFTGSIATVQIAVSGVGQSTAPSLGAFQLTVGYDASVLQLQSVTFGHPVFGDQLNLSGFGSSTFINSLTQGSLTLAEVSFDSANTLNSQQGDSFILATINFIVVAAGTTPLSVSNATFADASGNPLPVQPPDIHNGSLTAQTSVAIPGQTCISSATPATVRSEGTVEVLGSIALSCGAALAATPVFISVNIQPPTVRIASQSIAPDNIRIFPLPTVTTSVPAPNTPVAGVTVSVTLNSVNFSFTPVPGAQLIVISGIRVDVAGSGLANGASITGTLVASQPPVALSLTSPTVLLGNAIKGLSDRSGFGPLLSIASCVPIAPTPNGNLSVVFSNPDPSSDASSSLTLNLGEGFSTAWRTAAGEDNGLGGLQGTRFRIDLTGIPDGFFIYAPAAINSGALTLTRIAGANADGSGGSLTGYGPGAFENISISGGQATIVYEVTSTDALPLINSVAILIPFTASGTIGVGTIQGSVGLGPIGPPTSSAARPQFGPTQPKLVVQSILCASYLLFPWVVNTGDGMYDTGISISNTSADPLGTTGQKGDVTLSFWPSDGRSKPSPVKISPAGGLLPGQTATFVLSQMGVPFRGYIIATCAFQMAHGFAMISSPKNTGAPTSYWGLVIQSPVGDQSRTNNFQLGEGLGH
ncbi:MAG: hypothetical protein HYX72_08055 [Acidobacteria bacterium]|nr:hypothetical protein [Acidobacteriota bacterium]